MAHDIFLSYSSEDKPTADAVCATLESKYGLRCWIAPRDIIPGTEWAESLIDAIAGCQVMVLIFSAQANQSPQVKKEVERAVSKAIPIIPFRIEDVIPNKTLEYFISAPHWLDAITTPLERHISSLAKILHVMLDKNQIQTDGISNNQDRALQDDIALSKPIENLSKQKRFSELLRRKSKSLITILCFIGLILLTVAGSLVYMKDQDSKVAGYVEKSDAMMAAGEFDKAIELHDKILSAQPQNISIFLNRAFSHLYIGQYKKARKDCDKILEIDNNNAKALGFRSLSKSMQADISGAIQDGTSAIKIDSKCLFGYIGRGSALQAKGKIEAALEDGQKAVKLAPESAWANAGFSSFIPVDKNAELKLETASKAVALDMNLWFAYSARSLCYIELGEYEKAIADADEILRLSSGNPYGYALKVMGYMQLGKTERVVTLGKEAHKTIPDEDDFAALLVQFLAMAYSNNFEEALTCSNQMIAKAPEFFWGYSFRAIIMAGMENNEQARKDADKGVALNNSHPQAYQTRANVKKNIKDFSGALHDYNTAIRLSPFASIFYWERGQLYCELEQLEKALSDVSEAVRLNPYNDYYLAGRGVLYIKLERLEDAKADLEKALKRLNNEPLLWTALSKINYDLKDWDAAIKNATEAILLYTNYADGYHNRGKAYYEKGEIQDALNDLHRACILKPDNKDFISYLYKVIGEFSLSSPELLLEFLDTIKADKIIPMYAWYATRGNSFVAFGQCKKALREYDEAIKLNDKNWLLYSLRSQCRFSEGLLNFALKDAEAAFKLYSEYQPFMLLMRAQVRFCNGRIDEAEQDTARILDLKQKETHLSAYQILSLIYRVKGELNIAESYWEKAFQLNQKLSNKGIIVTKVHKGKNAEQCGIFENDKLLSYEGVPLWSPTDLQLLVHCKGKSKRTIKIDRGGKNIEYMTPKGSLGITMSQIFNQPEKQ